MIRKLKLEIDALKVETFESAAPESERGTVRGLLSAYYEPCNPRDTWQQTCTCELTCNADTCYGCGGGGGTDDVSCLDTCGPVPYSAPTCERDC